MLRDFIKDLRRKLADGKTMDQALADLRASGASIVECIFAIRQFRHCDLAEAKKVVHFSPAWADVREQHEQFHQELEEIAKESSDSE